MIHDYIVLGLLDDGPSENMLLDPKLILEKAVSMAYQSKVVNNRQGIVRGTSYDCSELQSENLAAVNSKDRSSTQKHKLPGKTTANKQPIKG